MISGLGISSSLPVEWVLSAAIVLVAGLWWLEWIRKPAYFYARLASIALLVLSLSVLVLRPFATTSIEEKPVLLLTPGSETEDIDSIQNLEDVEPMSFGYKASSSNATPLDSSELDQLVHRIKYVAGDGIPRAFLAQTPQLRFTHLPSHSPEGLLSLQVPQPKTGMLASLTGTYVTSVDSAIIVLRTPEGETKRAIVTNSSPDFSLSWKPKASGLFEYELLLIERTDTTRETLGLEVTSASPLDILFLQQAPTFDTRFLKGYLQEEGHRLALRYQVSKGVFRSEFVNRSASNLERLTTELLRSSDLIIAQSPSQLTSNESLLIEKAVEEGTGLLFLSPPDKATRSRLFPFTLSKPNRDTVRLTSDEWSGTLSFPAPQQVVKSTADVQKIWSIDESMLVAGYQLRGSGKIGFSFLSNLYPLLLEKQRQAYGSIWSVALEKVARPKSTASRLLTANDFPQTVDEWTALEAYVGSGTSVYFDHELLPLREDPFIENVWTSRFRTGTPGWHELSTSDSIRKSVYVYPTTAWPSLKRQATRNENAKHHVAASSWESKRLDTTKPFPLLPFFLLFLLSAGFLWLSPKL